MGMQHDTNEEQRRKYVTNMNEALALANIFPNAEDLTLQARYIAGSASLGELLDPARAAAARAEQRRRQSAMDFARASVSLSGLTVSEDFEKRARQAVLGEISLEEFLRKT